jgi:signal transduction histidine kinase
VDPPTILRDLRTLAIGAGAPGTAPRRPWILRRFGLPILLLGTLALGMGAVSGVRESGGGGPQIVAFLGVVPLTLLWYRPLVAWRIAAIGALLAEIYPFPGASDWPWAPASIPVYLVTVFGVGATQRAVVTIGVWFVTGVQVLTGANADNGPGIIIFVTIVMLIGDQVRRRRRTQRDLETAEERTAVLAERARIARELHDVVAHHMSMIAVRAETAQYRFGGVAAPVQEEFGQISAAAREGLVEMRRLLGVLRSENQETLTAPQPGLADLDDLVGTARAAGTTVTLEPLRDLSDVPPAVELTAYRIVQEALSNAGRHSPGAAVSVALTRVHNGLHVTVRNGPTARPPTDVGPGHGLRGMRERAAMLDGELTAGPAPDGGFVVHAVLPVAEGNAEGDR